MQISLEKANIRQHPNLYNQSIARHGQSVRWKSALPCYCLTEYGRTDPQCKKCFGRGTIFHIVETAKRIERGISLGGRIINSKKKISSIERLSDLANNSLAYSSFDNTDIILSKAIQKGKGWQLEYEENLINTFTGIGLWKGNGIIKVSIPQESSLQGNFTGEITKVNSATNTTQQTSINVLDFWDNRILTNSSIEESDSIEIDCEYVMPVKFSISNLSFKQKKERFKTSQKGELQATIPSFYEVGTGDMVTLLKATQKMATIGIVNGTYRLPVFYAKSIIRIEDNLGKIEGATIIRNNEIAWGGRKPTEKFSVSFTYNPTYLVDDDIPDPRHAENKNFPRKVILKKSELESKGSNRPRSSNGVY